jgi:hypothetical protein
VEAEANQLANGGLANQIDHILQRRMVVFVIADLNELDSVSEMVDHLLIILDGPLFQGAILFDSCVDQPKFTVTFGNGLQRRATSALLLVGEKDVGAIDDQLQFNPQHERKVSGIAFEKSQGAMIAVIDRFGVGHFDQPRLAGLQRDDSRIVPEDRVAVRAHVGQILAGKRQMQ